MPEYVGIDALWIVHKAKPEKLEKMEMPNASGDSPGAPHPVMMLSELYRDAVYEFTEISVDGVVTYSCCVDMAERRFEATGRTKKTAKLLTATAAMEALAEDGTLESRREEVMKAREVRQAKRAEIAERRRAIVDKRKEERENREHKNPPTPKNAVMRLHDLGVRPKAYSLVAVGDTDGHSGFAVTVLTEGKVYVGRGLSKRRAKLEAAESALKGLDKWTEEDEELKKEIVAKDEKKLANIQASMPVAGEGKKKKKKKAKAMDVTPTPPQSIVQDADMPDNYDVTVYERSVMGSFDCVLKPRKVPATTEPTHALAQAFVRPVGQPSVMKPEQGDQEQDFKSEENIKPELDVKYE